MVDEAVSASAPAVLLREPSPSEVREALAHILSQPEFLGANRLRHFLSFVVERALAGETESLKASTIAIHVFGRDEKFDAHANPIVRVEATRLRKALRGFYERAGAREPIEIELPTGNYVPLFRYRELITEPLPKPPSLEPRPVPPLPGRSPLFFTWMEPGQRRAALMSAVFIMGVSVVPLWQGLTVHAEIEPADGQLDPRPVLVMQPFETDGSSASVATAGYLQREMGEALSRFDRLRVRASSDGQAVLSPSVGFVLTGQLVANPPSLVLGLARGDGTKIWTQRHSLPSVHLEAADLKTLAAKLRIGMAQPMGVMGDDLIMRWRRGMPVPEGVSCALRAREYELRAGDDLRQGLVACGLTQITKRSEPVLGHAWLANLLVEEYITNKPASLPGGLDEAERHAREALRLGPERTTGYVVLARVLTLRGQKEDGLRLARHALEMNPIDPDTLTTLTSVLVVNGFYDEAMQIVQRLTSNYPRFASWVRFFAFIAALECDELDSVQSLIAAKDGPESPLSILARALMQASLGHDAAAQDALERLRVADPWLARDPMGALKRLGLKSEKLQHLAAAMAERGL
jgi:tetratricopeptide (TPR) repeat protein